jgi:carbon starvation protein
LSASYELFLLFMRKADAAAGGAAVTFYLDAALVGAVAVLAVVILADSLAKWYGFVIRKKPYTSSEVTVEEGGINIPAGPCC